MDNFTPVAIAPLGMRHLPTLVRQLALAAAALVLAMFGIYLISGIGQDPLQFVHPPQEYLAILQRNPPMLKLAIGLDNLFIVLYSSLFLMVAASLWGRTGSKALLVVAFSLLAAVGVFDLLENMHFLTMLAQAAQGMAIEPTQIQLQAWESQLKFHISYIGLFLLGYVLPDETRLERALCFTLRWVQLPIGLLIYITPKQIAVPLVMGRFSFFLFALLAISAIYRQRKYG